MKRYALVLLFFSVLFLSSCSAQDLNIADKIIPPANNCSPLTGVWKVEKYKQTSGKNTNTTKVSEWVNKQAAFSSNAALIGDDECTDPEYKIKSVNLSDYLLYQYKVDPKYLGLSPAKAEVITVTSKGNFFYEFIKADENEIIAYIDGTFIYFTKVSDSLKDINALIGKKHQHAQNGGIGSKISGSGILLGIRSYKKLPNSSLKVWDYKTLWISSEQGVLNKIYETNDLFVPRRTGFFKVGVNYTDGNGRLFAYPAGKQTDQGGLKSAKTEIPSTRVILYAGNDYISTEYTEFYGQTQEKSIYQVIPIDSVDSPKAVKISDISGTSGYNALVSGALESTASNEIHKNLYSGYDEENFALYRRNGHWIMKGRLNSSNSSSPGFFDYNIKAIPPSSLVKYDDLSVSWNRIKSKVPEAIDAYTSPEKDIALVITVNSILIYQINNGDLKDEPLKKLKLKETDTVVMAEWATGRYTEKWSSEFKKNNVHEVKD